MSEAVEYRLEDGSAVLFEIGEESSGIGRVGRVTDGVAEATYRLEAALGNVRHAAKASLEAFQSLSPEKLELEFGVKLTAEAGAVIAKTAAEGHFVVRVSWARPEVASAG